MSVHRQSSASSTDYTHLVQEYMLEMIRARRSGEKRDEQHDLFSGLLDAADEEAAGRVAISDRELMGKPNHYPTILPN